MQSSQLHGRVSNDAPGHFATVSDTHSIIHVQQAARLLNTAPIGLATTDAATPIALNSTDIVASGTTATFATSPPMDILPNTLADIGVLAIHDASDTPSIPITHMVRPRQRHSNAPSLPSAPSERSSAAHSNTRQNGKAKRDDQRIHRSIPSITANESPQPASNTIVGECAYTIIPVTPRAASESGFRPKRPAPNQSDIISAARIALARAPVSIT